MTDELPSDDDVRAAAEAAGVTVDHVETIEGKKVVFVRERQRQVEILTATLAALGAPYGMPKIPKNFGRRGLRVTPGPVAPAKFKAGRNDPCPCGSARKYKHCCIHKKVGDP